MGVGALTFRLTGVSQTHMQKEVHRRQPSISINRSVVLRTFPNLQQNLRVPPVGTSNAYNWAGTHIPVQNSRHMNMATKPAATLKQLPTAINCFQVVGNRRRLTAKRGQRTTDRR